MNKNSIIVKKQCHQCAETENLIECRDYWNRSIIPDFYSCRDHLERDRCFVCGRIIDFWGKCDCLTEPIIISFEVKENQLKEVEFIINNAIYFCVELSDCTFDLSFDNEEYETILKIKNQLFTFYDCFQDLKKMYWDIDDFLELFNYLKQSSSYKILEIYSSLKLAETWRSRTDLTIEGLKEIVYFTRVDSGNLHHPCLF